jgi:hypothetical protein
LNLEAIVGGASQPQLQLRLTVEQEEAVGPQFDLHYLDSRMKVDVLPGAAAVPKTSRAFLRNSGPRG